MFLLSANDIAAYDLLIHATTHRIVLIQALIIPNPYRIPVISLLIFVDSQEVSFCTIPSTIRGSVPIRLQNGIEWNSDTTIPATCPITIPVHLAHNGSWYPPTKKLLSGI